MKHTPGPWTVIASDEYSNQYVLVGHQVTDSEDEANVRLIAAAPDLLAACKMVASFAVGWEALTPGDIAEVTKAIAKAEGR